MELTLVGLANSGKTTFVNVIAVTFLLVARRAFTHIKVRPIHGGYDPHSRFQHAQNHQRKCFHQGSIYLSACFGSNKSSFGTSVVNHASEICGSDTAAESMPLCKILCAINFSDGSGSCWTQPMFQRLEPPRKSFTIS